MKYILRQNVLFCFVINVAYCSIMQCSVHCNIQYVLFEVTQCDAVQRKIKQSAIIQYALQYLLHKPVIIHKYTCTMYLVQCTLSVHSHIDLIFEWSGV